MACTKRTHTEGRCARQDDVAWHVPGHVDPAHAAPAGLSKLERDQDASRGAGRRTGSLHRGLDAFFRILMVGKFKIVISGKGSRRRVIYVLVG